MTVPTGCTDRRRALITTTIGAYPKPDYVPISDWFSAASSKRAADYTSTFAQEMALAGARREELFRRAATEVIDDQVEAGVDVVTDGEVRRENYVHYQCRHFSGFDFDNLSPGTIRECPPLGCPLCAARCAFSERRPWCTTTRRPSRCPPSP